MRSRDLAGICGLYMKTFSATSNLKWHSCGLYSEMPRTRRQSVSGREIAPMVNWMTRDWWRELQENAVCTRSVGKLKYETSSAKTPEGDTAVFCISSVEASLSDSFGNMLVTNSRSSLGSPCKRHFSLHEAEAAPVLRHGLLWFNVPLQQFGWAAKPNAGSYMPDSGKYGGPHKLCLLAETLDSWRSCAVQRTLRDRH